MKEPANDPSCLVKCHASATLLGAAAFLVTGVHVPLGEEAVIEIEVSRVEGQETRQEHALHLLRLVLEIVAVDEASSFGCMGVEVNVNGHATLFGNGQCVWQRPTCSLTKLGGFFMKIRKSKVDQGRIRSSLRLVIFALKKWSAIYNVVHRIALCNMFL